MGGIQRGVQTGRAPRLGGLVRRYLALAQPSPLIADPEERRRARMLCHVALALAVVLCVAAVISAITTTLYPDRDTSLGWGGTAIIAAAAVLFWIALARSKRQRYVEGAWLTIVTIDAFLFALAPSFPGKSASLAIAYAVPVLCATLFMRVKGTLLVFVISVVLATLHLLLAQPSVAEGSFIGAIMLVVAIMTVLVAHIREDDLRSVTRLRELEQRDAERLRGELDLASKVQRAMLPERLPSVATLELAAFSESAFEASGDFYDIFPIGDGDDASVGIVVCDVAGKGVASALVMSATRAALRAEAERAPSPAAVLAKVNDTLAASIPAELFVTIFYGVYDPSTAQLRYSAAGHPHPLRSSPGRTDVEELEAYGLPLGLVAGAEYEDRVATLDEGDVVVVYTDGLVEALNSSREMYGFDAVRMHLADVGRHAPSADHLLELALNGMWAFVGDERLHDDVTVVTMRARAALIDLGHDHHAEAAWTGGR